MSRSVRTLCRLALLALLPALAAPAVADDVHLVNGRSFEGVIAERQGDAVRIVLGGGEIRLPASRVARIEKGVSPLEEYLARRDELLAAGEGGTEAARRWLELARWAADARLAQPHREALLTAAELDPRLPGLASPMDALGFVFDEELGRWIDAERYMERRGYVRYGEGWITREEARSLLAAAESAAEERRREAAEKQAEAALELAIEARVQAEVARELAEERPYVHPGIAYGAAPIVVDTHGFFGHGHRHGHRHHGHGHGVGGAVGESSVPSPGHLHDDGNVFTQSVAEKVLTRDFGGRIVPRRSPPARRGTVSSRHGRP